MVCGKRIGADACLGAVGELLAQRHGVLTALALLKEHVQPVQGPLKPFQIPQHGRTRHKEVLLFWPASRSGHNRPWQTQQVL